jgi:hypothetical protein
MTHGQTDVVGTSSLVVWFSMSKAGVAKALRRKGVKPMAKRGAHGELMWPRQAAVDTLTACVVARGGPNGLP